MAGTGLLCQQQQRLCPDERLGAVKIEKLVFQYLGGGFKYFLFSPLFVEDSHFD